MNPVIAFALVCCGISLFKISFASAQTFSCYTELNGTAYNLTSLTGTEISGVSGDYTFYLNMCGVGPHCRRDGAMACQISNYDPINTQYDIAFSNDDVAPHNWTTIPNGVQLQAYGSGIYCGAEGNERRAVIQILCAPNVTTVPTSFNQTVWESPTCTYNMVIVHQSGCGYPVVPTLPPTSVPCNTIADTTTDQSKVTGAGFGVGVVVGSVLTGAIGVALVFLKRRSGGSTSSGATGKWNQFSDSDGTAVNMGGMGMNTETPRETN